ncbi:MAG: hypothetical protein DWQ31_12335 [Planctomycetota bacterium]|nr:MAG: hypothetical protein DWQ31_12335 [Planctomycetota bacterium]REK26484.1 MAG: hypothetical protein DWQ42_08785 [Planctomycetota bacterium]REK39404.1 MAG: hypothetical protein DWQ46_19215 [Planctomycetota bacterium]
MNASTIPATGAPTANRGVSRLGLAALILFGLVAVVFAPAWAAFAAAGVAVGYVITAALRRLRAARWRWLILVNVVALMLITCVVAMLAIPSLIENRGARGDRAFEADYSAEVHLDPDGETWQIADRVELREGWRAQRERMERWHQQVIAGETEVIEPADATREHWRQLATHLEQLGWQIESQTDGQLTAVRRRTAPVEQSWFAFRSSNYLEVLQQDDLPAGCALDNHAKIHLTVPSNFVGNTVPNHQSRRPSLAGPDAASEELVIAVDLPSLPTRDDGVSVVEAEVFHPWLRNAVAREVRAFAALPLGNWFIAGFFGVFHERLRMRILWPSLGWLLPFVWRRRASAGPVTETGTFVTGTMATGTMATGTMATGTMATGETTPEVILADAMTFRIDVAPAAAWPPQRDALPPQRDALPPQRDAA